jgi:hypothetical protein
MTRRIHSSAIPAQPIHRHHTCKINKQLILKVLKIAFVALVTLGLLFLQYPCLIAGFLVGVAFQPQTRKAVDRIKTLWMQKPWEMVGVSLVLTIVGFAVVIYPAAFFTGAYLGMRFAENRKR